MMGARESDNENGWRTKSDGGCGDTGRVRLCERGKRSKGSARGSVSNGNTSLPTKPMLSRLLTILSHFQRPLKF